MISMAGCSSACSRPDNWPWPGSASSRSRWRRSPARWRPCCWSGWPISTVELTADTSRFIGVALSIGALFACGGFGALWGARQPVRWALLSVLSTVAFFLIAYARLRGIAELPPWGLVSLALAAPAAIAAAAVARRRAVSRSYEESLGVYALAACGFIAFAIPLELEHAWIAVGWALLLPAIAWIEVAPAHRLVPIRGLGRGGARAGAAAAGAVGRRLRDRRDADLQLAALWLWRSARGLRRRGLAVPPRARRCARDLPRGRHRRHRVPAGDPGASSLLPGRSGLSVRSRPGARSPALRSPGC